MRRRKTTLAILALAASAAAASTIAVAARLSPLTPAPPSGTGLPSGQCIRSRDFRNHTIADGRTLLFDLDGRAVYRVTVNASCLAGAISSDPIVTRQPPGATIVCKPIDLDLAVVRSGFETRCVVDSIVRMTPEEVAALPRRLKP